MAVSFINDFNLIISSTNGENSTAEVCVEKISHYDWYQFALIPAVLVTLSLSVTKQRRDLLLRVCNGRPGLIYSMDTLTRSSRISYACAFGATAFLVYQIVLDQKVAINYTGDNKAVRSFVLIASMFIYGMVFFPLFTSLAVGSVYGYFMGTLYVWMLTGMEFYRLFQCSTPTEEITILLFFRGLPSSLCLLYLCVSLPVRMVLAWRRGHFFHWREDRQETNTIVDIRDSYVGHYVIKLLRKPKIKLPAETKKGRIIGILLSLAHRFIYQRKRGFRYPARILSVLFTAMIVVYTLSFEILALGTRLIDRSVSSMETYIELMLGSEQAPNEDPDITELRNFLWALIEILNVLKVCIIVSVVMAILFAVLNILHTLSSYRANLFALYRGDHSIIPPASFSSNTSHCVSSIKYGGFQVGYIVWGYLIQLVILLLVSIVLAMLILLIMYDFTPWLIFILELLWPILLTMVIVWISQFLLAKLVFLQERGGLLALNNRSVYFNFTYFMFFYNVFLGLASCLLRILKAMAVGIVFLSRLDSSTMPRRFEFIDPGFKAYVGYMHVEAAHTHPVLVVFCRLMLLGLNDKRDREAGKMNREGVECKKGSGVRNTAGSASDPIELVIKNNRVHANHNGNGSYDNPLAATTPTTTTTLHTSEEEDKEEERWRRRVAARFNWHVTYTLLHNPDIRVMRKGYLHMLRQARTMGVYIPVSDRQADVNLDQLQGLIAEARDKLNPSSKKKKEKDGDGDAKEELKEVVTAVKNGDVKWATKVKGPVGVLAAQMTQLVPEAAPQGPLPTLASSVPKAGQGVVEDGGDPPSLSVQTQSLVKFQHSNNTEREKMHDNGAKDCVAVEGVPPVRMSPSGPVQSSPQQDEGNHAAASPSQHDTTTHM